MDPVLRAYLYEQWCRDQEEQQELGKMVAILTGSFTNPEAARSMLKSENPDVQSSDEDFEKSLEMVKNQPLPPKRRVVRNS